MGLTDVPPSTAPAWLVPASSACVAIGVVFWLAAYVLMARRSLKTKATPVPIIALGLNLAWEVVWAVYVSDTLIERLCFGAWLVFDIPVLYATFRAASHSFASQPLIARHIRAIFGLSFVLSLAANGYFAWWWFAEPHRGYGIKWGKTWRGLEARDMTELSYWTSGVAQLAFSVGALAMLLQRGHSGGQSFGIWFCRFVGTQMGFSVSTILLWWHWPEAHGFVLHPLSVIMLVLILICDIPYPFLLAHVMSTETVLPDGRITSGFECNTSEAEKKKKRL